MTKEERIGWDFPRFFKTLVDFDIIPFLSCLRKKKDYSNLNRDTLFDFTNPSIELQEIWGPLDDVVMGGVSKSQFLLTDNAAFFTGEVSTANSGGFASARTCNLNPPLDLSGFTGIRLQIKGDGNRYKFIIRDQDKWDGLGYCYSFSTIDNSWITIDIPFAQMIPVFRAKTVSDATPFNSAKVSSLQLMLSKFEYDGALNPEFTAGRFSLEIRTISTYT